MASLHSVTLDEEGCSHYYHCVIHRIPAAMSLQIVADFIVPSESSPVVKTLAELGCRIVPHKLHCFKESLPTKFGFVTYFLHHKADGTRDDVRMHELFLEWVTTCLPKQMQCDVTVRLAQPPNCCQSGPFFKELHNVCPVFAPGGVTDVKKVETFLLCYVNFAPALSDEPSSPIRGGANDQWGCVGTMVPERIPAVELAWLRKEIPSFPEKADVASLITFFNGLLNPLIYAVTAEEAAGSPTVATETEVTTAEQ